MENLKNRLSDADLNESMPQILKETVELLQDDFINVNPTVILNYIICNLFRMFSSKKITIDEAGNSVLFNWFSLIFMDSGDGKDRLATVIDGHLLKQFKDWYQTETEKLYQEQLDEYEKKVRETKDKEKEKNDKNNNAPF